MGTKTAATYLPYKVKDMSLAEYGRREIQLAEAEMPGFDGAKKGIWRNPSTKGSTNCWMFAHDNSNSCIN